MNSKEAKRFIEEAIVPYIPFHNLRHTHATMLMRMSGNPKVLSELETRTSWYHI